MTHALTLTLPIKQDAATLAKLKALKDSFAGEIQGEIAKALKKSQIVHFARVVAIDDKYIQVITEYEGPHPEYTEFFRKELTPVFAGIFALAAKTPDVSDPDKFWEYSRDHNIQSLGVTTSGSTDFNGKPAGWLFSAYDGKTVKEIQADIVRAGG